MKPKVTFIIIIVSFSISFTKPSLKNPDIEKKIRETFYPKKLLTDSISYEEWIEKDSLVNKNLWYLEIQYPFKTNYTSYWNSNHKNQYFANTEEFTSYFEKNDSILMAIQVGPIGGLWTFQQFLFRKLDDKIIVSNSCFRHNRFIYKGFTILSQLEFDAFYKETIELREETIRILSTLDYEGTYIEVEVDLSDFSDFSTTEIEMKCPNSYSTSGIIVDKLKNITTKLYGFSDSQCEKNKRVERIRDYQNKNWWKAIKEFEWVETYPDE